MKIVFENAACILHNASVHGRKATERALRDAQTFRMLPPYSAMKIMEIAISTFKAALKRSLEEARPYILTMHHVERMVHLSTLPETRVDAIQSGVAEASFRKMPRAGFE